MIATVAGKCSLKKLLSNRKPPRAQTLQIHVHKCRVISAGEAKSGQRLWPRTKHDYGTAPHARSGPAPACAKDEDTTRNYRRPHKFACIRSNGDQSAPHVAAKLAAGSTFYHQNAAAHSDQAARIG